MGIPGEWRLCTENSEALDARNWAQGTVGGPGSLQEAPSLHAHRLRNAELGIGPRAAVAALAEHTLNEGILLILRHAFERIELIGSRGLSDGHSPHQDRGECKA